MQTASKKVVNGWAMYDWANSVYNLVITSTVFPAYFEAITGDGNENTKQNTLKHSNLNTDFNNKEKTKTSIKSIVKNTKLPLIDNTYI